MEKSFCIFFWESKLAQLYQVWLSMTLLIFYLEAVYDFRIPFWMLGLWVVLWWLCYSYTWICKTVSSNLLPNIFWLGKVTRDILCAIWKGKRKLHPHWFPNQKAGEDTPAAMSAHVSDTILLAHLSGWDSSLPEAVACSACWARCVFRSMVKFANFL